MKLKERFFAVPDGQIHPRWFEVGDEVTGSVLVAAKELNLVEENKAIERAPENKMEVRRGRPPKRG